MRLEVFGILRALAVAELLVSAHVCFGPFVFLGRSAWNLSCRPPRRDRTGRNSEAHEPAQLHHDQPHRNDADADLDPVAGLPRQPRDPRPAGRRQELIASGIFIVASITDGLDGYLARRRKQITTLGMLLDPLADKLMVTAAYIILVAYNPRIVPPWIAVIIIGREFLVSGLRSIAASEGFTIEASEIGKLKTVIQIVSVVAAILAHRWNYWNWGGFIIAVHMIALWAI